MIHSTAFNFIGSNIVFVINYLLLFRSCNGSIYYQSLVINHSDTYFVDNLKKTVEPMAHSELTHKDRAHAATAGGEY